jgi:hypothetical protein
VLVHACNSSYLGSGGRRIMIWGWPGQKGEALCEKAKGLGVWVKW